MLPFVKTEERRKARDLRARGWSIKEIERHLGVSRSSVSRWVRGVELEPEMRQALVAKVRPGPLIAAERKAARARSVRLGYQVEGRRLARERSAEYAAGCALYWAEGSRERNVVKLTNSDPEMLAYFADFLRTQFGVSSADIVIRCNLFADHLQRQEEIEDVWLKRLGLARSSLRASTINTYSKYSKKKRTNKLPYGTCALLVYSTKIAQTLLGSIQELGGFDRPAWLD